jgi:hypothetical protein
MISLSQFVSLQLELVVDTFLLLYSPPKSHLSPFHQIATLFQDLSLRNTDRIILHKKGEKGKNRCEKKFPKSNAQLGLVYKPSGYTKLKGYADVRQSVVALSIKLWEIVTVERFITHYD